MIKEVLIDIASNYLNESKNKLSSNSFAERVRADGKTALKNTIRDDNLLYKASVGQGNWAAVPWLGIFNPESTTSATHGIYVVYLFSANFEKVYLCQGQGVTKVKEDFGKGQIDELQRRAALICARVPEHTNNFETGGVRLGGVTSLAKEYDSAIAYFKKYDLKNLPESEVLEDDLCEAVLLYKLLIARGGTDNFESIEVLDNLSFKVDETIIERRKYVRHMKIERNAKAAKLAKSVHGYTCQGCGVNLQNIYGEAGKDYIEAHHLKPLHTLVEGESVKMDIVEDFAVLCANCHKIVHRTTPVMSIEELRLLPGVKMLRKAFRNKYSKSN